MILTFSLLGGIVLAWLLVGVIDKLRLGLSLPQALLYVPFKLAYRIRDGQLKVARQAKAPVIYVVVHQSRLDPALMLSLLPDDTLHILDEASAKSFWLEPWRELARTIAFNAEHVFVSRRLVRVLKGNGRLAVYLPDEAEPDVKALRLYRAVAHIALRADARVVPISVSRTGSWLPRCRAAVREPATIAELTARNDGERPTPAGSALFARVAEARRLALEEPGHGPPA